MTQLATRLEIAAKILGALGTFLGAAAAIFWAVSPATVADVDWEKIAFITQFSRYFIIGALIFVLLILPIILFWRLLSYHFVGGFALKVLGACVFALLIGWFLSPALSEAVATVRYFAQETYGRAFRRHLIYEGQISEAEGRYGDALALYRRADSHLDTLRRSDIINSRIAQIEGLLAWGLRQQELANRGLERYGNTPESFKRLSEAFAVYPINNDISLQFGGLLDAAIKASNDLEQLTGLCSGSAVTVTRIFNADITEATARYIALDRHRELLRGSSDRQRILADYCGRVRAYLDRGFDLAEMTRSLERIWGWRTAIMLIDFQSEARRADRGNSVRRELAARLDQARSEWVERTRFREVLFGSGQVRALRRAAYFNYVAPPSNNDDDDSEMSDE